MIQLRIYFWKKFGNTKKKLGTYILLILGFSKAKAGLVDATDEQINEYYDLLKGVDYRFSDVSSNLDFPRIKDTDPEIALLNTGVEVDYPDPVDVKLEDKTVCELVLHAWIMYSLLNSEIVISVNITKICK